MRRGQRWVYHCMQCNCVEVAYASDGRVCGQCNGPVIEKRPFLEGHKELQKGVLIGYFNGATRIDIKQPIYIMTQGIADE